MSAPTALILALRDKCAVFAHNAAFDRLVWEHVLRRDFDDFPSLEESYVFWVCTAGTARSQGFPGGLDAAAKSIGLIGKFAAGKKSMLKLSKPKTVVNGAPVWYEDIDDSLLMYSYCKQDVDITRQLMLALRDCPVPRTHWGLKERALFLLDYKINNRGIRLDTDKIKFLSKLIATYIASKDMRVLNITDGALVNVRSTPALKKYLMSAGLPILSVDKSAVASLLARDDLSPVVREVLTIRQELSKTSIAKLQAMIHAVESDQRVRGCMVYYGATTGRWSGRLIQPQNLPRNLLGDRFAPLREAMIYRDRDPFVKEAHNGTLIETSAQLLRSLIIPSDGCKLVGGDYSSIETRVLFWLANDTEALQVVREGGDIYKYTASPLFKRDATAITDEQRQVGKRLVLGCGYGMGAAKFQQTCSQSGLEITKAFAEQAVGSYRRTYAKVTKFWKACEDAFRRVVSQQARTGKVSGGKLGKIVFSAYPKCVCVGLPSGRQLVYNDPSLTPDGRICYQGINTYTRQWGAVETYGGRLVENIVQACARDIIAEALIVAESRGVKTVLTVHDEILGEIPIDARNILGEIMSAVPSWAEGLPITSEVWEDEFYSK